jgi:hypothetical protein
MATLPDLMTTHLACFSSAVKPKGGSLPRVADGHRGRGVDDRVRVKSLHEVDDEDARGRCPLFGGIVMALHVLLRFDHLGNP